MHHRRQLEGLPGVISEGPPSGYAPACCCCCRTEEGSALFCLFATYLCALFCVECLTVPWRPSLRRCRHRRRTAGYGWEGYYVGMGREIVDRDLHSGGVRRMCVTALFPGISYVTVGGMGWQGFVYSALLHSRPGDDGVQMFTEKIISNLAGRNCRARFSNGMVGK